MKTMRLHTCLTCGAPVTVSGRTTMHYKPADRWIPVEEGLPEINKYVQVTDGEDVGIGYWDYEDWGHPGDDGDDCDCFGESICSWCERDSYEEDDCGHTKWVVVVGHVYDPTHWKLLSVPPQPDEQSNIERRTGQ